MAYVLDLELGGRPLRLETGKLAGQANGSVLVRYGDTVVLVTATMSDGATVSTSSRCWSTTKNGCMPSGKYPAAGSAGKADRQRALSWLPGLSTAPFVHYSQKVFQRRAGCRYGYVS